MTRNDLITEIEHPPCKLACPILTDVREYVQLIAERRFEEAFVTIRKQNPLPRVCGRICTHPCETACKRGQVEEPIAIAALKRFAADGLWRDQYEAALPGKSTGHKVAVVGSGPAGLAAAHDLALLGHGVTIFEALPVLGGMLRVGVPEYRLPKNVVDEEIQAILDLGVEVKTGVRIGEEIKLTDLSEQGYKAVFVAIGAHKDHKLGIAGEDQFEGVVSAVSFLRAVNQDENPNVGKQVAVIGGGNTAVDSARCLLRMGADTVHIAYRRSRDEMPAAQEEIEEAIHEGIQITYLTSPVEILGKDGNVSALKCIKNELGEPDVSGRRSPKPVPGSEFTLDVDMVIAAIGQAPDSSFLADELELTQEDERIDVEDPYSLVTSHPGVFAGGDAVTGPATAIQAIAAGKQAAISIDLYLRGEALPTAEPSKEGDTRKLPATILEKTRALPRCRAQVLFLENRLGGFDEVALGLSGEQAVLEAQRCLHCNLGAYVDEEQCIRCGACAKVCPLEIPSVGADGKVDIDIFQCQACGTCVAECPVQAVNVRLCPHGYIVSEVESTLSQSRIADPLVVGLFSQYGKFTINHLHALGRDFPQIVPVTTFGLERVSVSDLLRTFQLGADGIIMAEAPGENRLFSETQTLVEKRSGVAKEILDLLGLGGGRLTAYTMPQEGLFGGSWLAETIERIKALGPNPPAAVPEKCPSSMSIQELIEKTKVSICQDCGVCTGSCPVSRVSPGFSPQDMVGKFVLSADLGLEDEALGEKDVWSCLTCGLCLERCPYKVEYLEFVRAVREEAFRIGNKATYAHDGIMQTIVQMQRSRPQNKTSWAREAGSIREEGDYYLFVGCLPYLDVVFRDMGVSLLGSASDMLKILNKLGIEPVVSDEERCCGHDMLWTGNIDLFKELAAFNIELIKRCGCKKVIFGCPEGYLTFKTYYPFYLGELPFEAVHFYDLVGKQINEGAFQLAPMGRTVTYQDPCRLGRMAGIYDSPREIIASIPGIKFVEMERNREEAVCCGISCWANCSSYSKQIQMDRIKEAQATGADTLITACPKCNIHFACALSSSDIDMEVKDLTHVMASAMDI